MIKKGDEVKVEGKTYRVQQATKYWLFLEGYDRPISKSDVD